MLWMRGHLTYTHMHMHLYTYLLFSRLREAVFEMVASKKSKKTVESINSRLALVVKSGK